MHRTLLGCAGEAGTIDGRMVRLDCASVPAQKGRRPSPRPTDRGRPGTKRLLAVDHAAVPHAIWLTGANYHDAIVFDEVRDAISPIKWPSGHRRKRLARLPAGQADDIPHCRRAFSRRHVTVWIARKGKKSSTRLRRHRWVDSEITASFYQYSRSDGENARQP